MGPISLVLMFVIILFRVYMFAKAIDGTSRRGNSYTPEHYYRPYNQVTYSTPVRKTSPERPKRDLAEQLLHDYESALSNSRDVNIKYGKHTGWDDSRQNLLRVLRMLIDHVKEVRAVDLYTIVKYKCGLLVLAMYEKDFKNKVTDWKPNPSTPAGDPQFHDLVKFLLVKYDVPAFVKSSWFDLWAAQGRYWYLQLGNGAPVKNLEGMPTELTRMEAHWLLKTPENYGMNQAVRWAQLKAMDAPDDMILYIMQSYLGWSFGENEDFVKEVLRWFAQHKPYHYVLTPELVSYAEEMHKKHPDWSIKGRTIEALIEQSREFHDFNREEDIVGYHKWEPSGVGSSTWAEWDKLGLKGYQLVELLDTKELEREGEVMDHCVATYAYTCLSYRSTIFSLRKDEGNTEESVATIEVDLINKRIAQAMGQEDTPVGDKVEKWLRQWAEVEGLTCPTTAEVN